MRAVHIPTRERAFNEYVIFRRVELYRLVNNQLATLNQVTMMKNVVDEELQDLAPPFQSKFGL